MGFILGFMENGWISALFSLGILFPPRKNTSTDIRCFRLGNGNLMCVDCRCGGCIGVPQFICCGDKVNAVGNHHGGHRVPEGMGDGYAAADGM